MKKKLISALALCLMLSFSHVTMSNDHGEDGHEDEMGMVDEQPTDDTHAVVPVPGENGEEDLMMDESDSDMEE